MFTEKDWEGIITIYNSVKEKEPLKVGRFGLGFKSVFHMTGKHTTVKPHCVKVERINDFYFKISECVNSLTLMTLRPFFASSE